MLVPFKGDRCDEQAISVEAVQDYVLHSAAVGIDRLGMDNVHVGNLETQRQLGIRMHEIFPLAGNCQSEQQNQICSYISHQNAFLIHLTALLDPLEEPDCGFSTCPVELQ